MAFYKKPIQPYDPIQEKGQDGGALRYFRNDFDHTGQNSHDTPPSQDAGQWMSLFNTMPISKGNIDRRWGYFSLSNLGLATPAILAPRHFYTYQRDTDGLRKLIICTTQPTTGNINSLALGEDGSIYASPITTAPTSLPLTAPRMLNSRSTAYFYAGIDGSNQKWDGSVSNTGVATNVTKWGINVDDVAASSSGPNLPTTAADVTGGDAAWVNPNNIKLADSVYAVTNLPFSGAASDNLKATNFGLTASGHIAGIKAEFKGHIVVTGNNFFVFRPTAYSGTYASPALATDGDSATSSVGNVTAQAFETSTETWRSMPAYTGPAALTQVLKISSKFSFGGQGISDAEGKIEYSLNNGSTWTTLYDAHAARSLTTDSITLSTSQDLTQIQARAFVSITADHGGANHSIVDIWVEVTNSVAPIGKVTLSAQLVKTGTAYGNIQTVDLSAATDTVVTLGGAQDLWGGSFQSTDITDPTFGIQFTVRAVGGPTICSMDYVKLTISLTGAGVVIGSPTAGSVSLTVGRIYYEAFRNSTTGHVSDLSSPSATTGPQTSKRIPLTLSVNNDPQVGTKLVLATADGGDPDILYLVEEIQNSVTAYTDNTPEDTLILNQQYLFTDDFGNDFGIANNTPPPLGTLSAKHKGRLWMALDQLLYFSKSISELTLPNGFVAGRYEEAWPATNYFDISPGAESVTGLLSDGDVLYIATARHIRRLFGDDPSNFQEPEVVHQESGVLNQEVWQPIFMQGTPSGTMWLTPDNRVIMSDFNTYRDAGEPVQDILDRINPSAKQNAHAQFFSQGAYDIYILAVPTGTNTYCDTLLVYDLRTQQWQVWQPTDPTSSMLFNVTDAGVTQWLFTTVPTSGTDSSYVYQFSSTVTQDQVGKVATPSGPQTAQNVGVDFITIGQTSWLDLGSPTYRKLLNEVEIVGDFNCLLTVEGADTQADFAQPELIIQDSLFSPDPAGRLRVSLAGYRTRKRYYRFTFKSTGPSQDMLDSYSIYVIPLSTV